MIEKDLDLIVSTLLLVSKLIDCLDGVIGSRKKRRTTGGIVQAVISGMQLARIALKYENKAKKIRKVSITSPSDHVIPARLGKNSPVHCDSGISIWSDMSSRLHAAIVLLRFASLIQL